MVDEDPVGPGPGLGVDLQLRVLGVPAGAGAFGRRVRDGHARLLKLGEIVEVTVPSVASEAARDLVRAREDCRGDLMRERPRLSKLLLRNGIVFSGGQAWSGVHDAWLRRQAFDLPARQAAFESAYEAVALTSGRRDRLDAAIATAVTGVLWAVFRLGVAYIGRSGPA